MKYFVLLTFIFSLNITANVSTQKRQKLLKMISKEIKTIKKIRNRGPNLEYRLLELYTENLKIIKEVENKKFLKNRNPKLKKPHFFKQSVKLNKKVETLGLYITKRWKNYRSNAHIFYTLALNERDFNFSKNTERYLLKSLRVAPHGSPIVHHVKTTLAEMYYNNKKYSKAVRLYKDVIKNNGDEWYAKHHYNYSWCLLKTKRLSMALEHMLAAFKYSRNSRYVSVESQVLDAISILYIQNDKIKEGTEFYITKVEEPAEYITKFATRAQTTRKYQDVNAIIVTGIESAKDKKQHSQLVHYYNYQLEFYRTYKRTREHLTTTEKLTDLFKLKHLNGEELTESIEKVKSYVGFLQIKLSKNKKINIGDYDQELLKNTLSYFDFLKTLDKDNKQKYLYFQGETLFSVGEFKMAYGKYAKTLENMKRIKKVELAKAKKEKKQPTLSWDDKFAKKVINSLLASLERFEGTSNTKYQTYVYSNHVNIWPKDKKSKLIYPKLFTIYFKKKNLKKTINIVKNYNKNFPEDLKAQKGMFAKVFDYYVERKNISVITYWINEFNNGFLSYEPQYIKKATIILGNLLFNKIDKKIEEKKYAEVLSDYNKIIENEEYPNKIKTQALFRSSLIYLKVQNTKKSYNLITKSFKADRTNELFKETSAINNMIDEYALSQDFNRALSLSYRSLRQFCKKSFKEKNDIYKKAITHSVVENNLRAIRKLNILSHKCNLNISATKEIIIKHANLLSLEGKLTKLQEYRKIYPNYISKKLIAKTAETKFWYFIGEELESKANQMRTVMVKNRSKNVKAIDSFNNFNRELKELRFVFKKETFNGEKFNKEIEIALQTIKRITASAQKIQSFKHPEITPKASTLVAAQYKKLIKNISNYMPIGFNKEETQMFRKQLNPLVANLRKEMNSFNMAAIDTTKSNKILSYSNHSLEVENKSKSRVLKRYPATMLSLSLDLQGVQ
jgi:hypothetical protein